MTDEQPPDSESRRSRLETRRRRLRFLGIALAVVLVVAGVSTAVELRKSEADTTTRAAGKTAAAKRADGSSTTLNLGDASKLEPPRALSHDKPLKLWVGGDSLAGSFGPALGQIASATGVVDTTIDYKVSSGLEDQGIRDWQQHAQEKMTADNPDAVVFIIGTNDASIVNTYDGNNDGKPDYEADYRAKVDRMMETLVGGTRHRTVLWLGPPTLGSSTTMDKGAKALGILMRQEAAKFSPDVVYVDTYHLFSDTNGEYSSELPDAHGNMTQMRISDGIHFTVDGATYLAGNVWKLLNQRWHITAQADPAYPIDYTIAEGSNDYVPGVGRWRPSSNYSGGSSSGSSSGSSASGGSSGTPTTISTSTRTTVVAHTPTTVVTATTTPHVTTPTTQPHTTTPTTSPHTTPPTPTTTHTPAP